MLDAHNSQLSDMATQLNSIVQWKDSFQSKGIPNKSTSSDVSDSVKRRIPYLHTVDHPYSKERFDSQGIQIDKFHQNLFVKEIRG